MKKITMIFFLRIEEQKDKSKSKDRDKNSKKIK